LGIDDVEAAAAIHEYLGEACVGDNEIDNKRVDPRIGDVFWVVITVESDGHLGPVKEEGGCGLHEEDLLMFPLALACREARRGSFVYHEAVVDLGEPLILVVSHGIFLLVVFLDAYAFKISSEHVAVLEVVVRGPFVVGTWLFEHFVENAPAGGPSRFLAISSSNKVISQGLKLALLVLFLLPVVPL
jgi:hypothetical protein